MVHSRFGCNQLHISQFDAMSFSFCVGEFTTSAIGHEGGSEHMETNMEGARNGERLLGSKSSIFTFTSSFADISRELGGGAVSESDKSELITIDGGPHTLWW